MTTADEGDDHVSAPATAMLSVYNINEKVKTMNRSDLLCMLNLSFDMTMVQDMDKLHPVTVYVSSTLRVGR